MEADRRLLETIEGAGTAGDGAIAGVAFVAARSMSFDAAELGAARRRALLLLAAGGDPTRPLDLDARAVSSLARELDEPSRRDELASVLRHLSSQAAGLPALTTAVDALLEDRELAWRWVALALLADELSGEPDG